MPLSKGAKAGIAIGAVIFVVAVAAFTAVFLVLNQTQAPRCSPWCHPKDLSIPNRPASSCRVRIVNTHMLPIGVPIKRMAKRALKNGLFDGVDVVLFQELFRRPRILGPDPSQLLTKKGGPVQLAVAEVATPRGYATDSGLAAAAVHPWKIRFVAFKPFKKARKADKIAQKGVAVFEINGHIRLATTHLQASYSKLMEPHDDEIRKEQFEETLAFANRFGAILLAGDMNVSDPVTLAYMDEVVEDIGGTRILDDGMPTGSLTNSSTREWRKNSIVHGHQLDHAWVLDQDAITSDGRLHTNEELTKGWSDHAALDFSIHFKAEE